MVQAHRKFSIHILLALMIFLTACGNSSDPEATPEPTATEAPPTPAEGQLTVRDLVTMANDAWPSVTTMRITSQSGSIPAADAEEAPLTGTVEDWDADGNLHLLEFQEGTMVNEQIYVDGTIYMRGQFVSSAVAPELDVNTWVILDPQISRGDTPVGFRVRYLTREITGPYGEFTEDTLAQPLNESGKVTVGDRSCTLYSFGDENETGTEIRVEIAVDDSGLPCQIIQRAGDFQNSTVFVFNLETDIAAPLEGTPVSGTPEG